ncbi:hypothetical protein MMC16_002324 [Acarospora aff. strigata]|nr:hypothetical protein [Acarospora aff. strigata]
MPALTTSLFLLVLLTLLPLTESIPTALPASREDDNLRTSHLQRRQITCDPTPGQALDYASCQDALSRIPGAGIPLVGGDSDPPLHHPREFVDGGCRIAFNMTPGIIYPAAFRTTLKHRATLLVNRCVGGLPNWALPNNNMNLVPGRSGTDTYFGVVISVSRVATPVNVQ